MKFSDIAMLILVISGVFAVLGLAINDYSNAYPEVEINQTRLDKYNQADEIEDRIAPLKNSWEQIQNEDKGWKKFVTGLAAIPNVIIAFPAIVFSVFSIAGSVLTDGAKDLVVPLVVIGIILTMVTVYLLFKLVGWWQRSPT